MSVELTFRECRKYFLLLDLHYRVNKITNPELKLQLALSCAAEEEENGQINKEEENPAFRKFKEKKVTKRTDRCVEI